MERGAISIADLPGGLDLVRTIESGQTYHWRRSDGGCYGGQPPGDAWYETAIDLAAAADGRDPADPDPDLLRVRTRDGRLEWRATDDPVPALRRLLRLEDDLEAIAAALPAAPPLGTALERHRGMRLVADPPFVTTVSFICSAQMRVPRIHDMVAALARTYGTPVSADGRRVHAFPTPAQLAEATEAELRSLGLGYRAPYVRETARMVADGADIGAARDREYEAARAALQRFVGVGEKVADCILLFSLGFDQAVPLDTWIRRAIAERFPECDRDGYAATSRAIRERLGGEHAGYAQTYLFHHLRTADGPVAAAD